MLRFGSAAGAQQAAAALTAALVLEFVSGCVGVAESDPAVRLASGLLTAGSVLLVALALTGVCRGARWGAWLGAGLAILTVVLALPVALFSLFGRVEVGEIVVTNSPLSALLECAKGAAYVLFLLALVTSRRRS